MKIGLIGVVALALLASAGCGGGQSAADKAKSQACDASSDIQAQVDTLKGLPLSPDSVDKAKTALQKINSDLDTIATAAPDGEGRPRQPAQGLRTPRSRPRCSRSRTASPRPSR